MNRAVAFFWPLAALSLILTWELTGPEPGTYGAAAPDTAAHSRAGQMAPTRPATSGYDAGALAGIAASVVARPLFSPRRHPAGRSAAVTAVGAVGDGLPRLTGTIVGPAGARAIFAGSDGKSRAAAEGDAVGDFMIRAIGPGQVTLSGSDGERVLRPTYVLAPVANAIPAGTTRPPEGMRLRGPRGPGPPSGPPPGMLNGDGPREFPR